MRRARPCPAAAPLPLRRPLLLSLLLVLLAAGAGAGAGAGAAARRGQSKEPSPVVELGLASFDSSVQDGSPWLVMVYAPWCAHCKALEPTWRQLASALEGEVKVGRVDGSAETLLGKRLGVRAYPSIFFMHEGVFVEYGQGDSRDLARLTKFARGGWKDATPAPWWKAPNSAFGRATAGLWHLPGALQGTYEGLTESGWSDHSLVAAAIMAAVASGLVAIALLDCCVAGGFKLHLE